MMKNTKTWFAAGLVAMTMTVAACGNNASEPASGSDAADAGNTSVKLLEGWFSKGEDGGYFAALQQDYYKESGIDMTIQPGGPEVSAMQLVASGKADFGISYADEILKAREQGIPVVGILAGFQYTPQVLIYHKGEEINGFEDLDDKTVYMGTAVPYWEYIKNKYELSTVQEMKYTGQLVNFINDKNALNQGYITNEPYVLAQQGVDVDVLKIADSGYANYADVLFTTEDYIKKHPEVVKAVVQASQKGWSYYLDNYKTVNPLIQTYNPDVTLEALDYEAEHQKEFISTDETTTNGIGFMTNERWTELLEQMLDAKGLSKEQDVSKAFTTEFLAKP
ncbi:myristoyl transferase [Paenibacillus sp. FSL H8-0548]|uniref:ABC transporter substrate-binding protein n=1 Tax=Paenibacillus sp. FSL H8-0548 TaxID=1920422 RepID=UPI00096FB4E4|nr:ABC transporter substrate-binding protein [Paenibacillus sp. FSL H8-0548]OMF27184.1 myristoyl transferase [Paenibacillus sp. FSL H8-0548]